MHVSTRLIALGCLAFASLSGCNNKTPGLAGTSDSGGAKAPGVGTVAILDLDMVAKQLGRDKQMNNSIQQCQVTLNQQLAAIKASYEKQISEKQGEFGDTPTHEQVQHLASVRRQASVNLNQVQQKARNNLSQHGAQLIQRFRDEMKPIAREAAAEKGLSVIVTKNDNVIFDYDAAVDITEAVVQKMLARQASGSPSVEN